MDNSGRSGQSGLSGQHIIMSTTSTLSTSFTNEFIKALTEKLKGELHFDPITRHVYSVDASIFEIVPLGIFLPQSRDDLINAVKIAHSYRVPVTVRGAATGITGGCLGHGLIIDTSKYLHQILEVDISNGTVTCEPGVVQDDLNNHLSSFGFRLGPDTSTGNRATLGGMLANNAAGSHSLHFGKMSDHVLSVELILANGTLVTFASISEEEWKQKCLLQTTEGRIYKELWKIRDEYGEEINVRFPKIPRRVSGYNLDELFGDKNSINIAKLVAGSEGTLGIVTKITLRIVPKLRVVGLCLLTFDNILKALKEAPKFLSYSPIAVELIDHQIIELGLASPSMRGKLDWLQGNPQALIVVEFEGEDSAEVEEKLNAFTNEMQRLGIGDSRHVLIDSTQMSNVWALRKAGLGILLSKRTYSRAIAFIEDISIPPEKLAVFMERFCGYLESKGKTAGIYGHVGAGCLHIRPYMNLLEPEELTLMHTMMNDVSDLLLEYGGALSGEHGDGLIRSWLNPKMFGPNIAKAFLEVKRAFDPHNLMNPGKIVPQSEGFEPLRFTPVIEPKTFLNFKSEGGISLAVDLCNGNGLCRKSEGVMCPSFQATRDEFHSTRARAQALRALIHERLPMEDLTSQGMHDVMDLCLSCKGCKTECPSQVDMAKMKAEFLYQYQNKHGLPLRQRLFGSIGMVNRIMSSFPKLFNWLNCSLFVKMVLGWVGISPKRHLPSLAIERFSKWMEKQTPNDTKTKRVVLFNDTFTEFNEPHIGQAAYLLLQKLGYEVIVPPWICCGRPQFSKGMLEQARKQAKAVISMLMPYANEGIPIVGLEPSCLLMIKDDYKGLIEDCEKVASHCYTFDEFINGLLKKGEFSLSFKEQSKIVKVHGHCHQKSLIGMKPTLEVLKAIPGYQVSEIPSGCCGMAGSFGYEKEHYDISMKIGSLHLFPAIELSATDTLIVASGTSCRHQITDGTGRRSSHLAEVLLNSIEI